MAEQQKNADSSAPQQGPPPRDLHRYETTPAKILQSLGITVVGGIILVLVLRYVVGVGF